ncbi:MAG: GDSL-type esterase/lipase family protein, partial [Planctomycetota bacterium]
MIRLLVPLLLAAAVWAQEVVILGDSLTAGYGLRAEHAYPALLAAAWRDRGWQVTNAGKSGDTTKGGLARLDWQLRRQPDVLVVALGANDGLRGLPPATIAANLTAIITRARA